jgi:hypothetical protein
VNLSIHPALIDQPIVVPIASAQTGKTFVWQCARASKMLCACDGVTFCTSAWPIVAMDHGRMPPIAVLIQKQGPF